jgi:transcriptional regulator with XRE-family HTH domain
MDTDDESPNGTLGRNLAAIRKRRGLTVRALSERLAELGVPLLPSGVTKIETGQRRVDVGDLLALAAALNVAPARLLLPDSYGDDEVAVTPRTRVPTWLAWSWAEGHEPLADDPSAEQEQAYEQERPADLRAADQAPVSRAARALGISVRRLAREAASPTGDVERRIENARRNLARVAAEIDALEDELQDGGARRG